MPVFRYEAKLGPEHTITGDIEANDERTASLELVKQGYFPLAVAPARTTARRFAGLWSKNAPRRTIVLFSRQLADLLESGMTVRRALQVVAEQTPNAAFKRIVKEVLERVNKGDSLSKALGGRPDLFPAIFVSLIKTGEESGTLAEVLRRLADYLEGDEEMKRNIKNSLVYPAFVLAVGVISVVVLLALVVPRLVEVFEDMGQALPLPTRILLSSSEMLSEYWWVFLGLAFVLAAAVSLARRSAPARGVVDGLKLRLPIVKSVHLKSELVQYTRTLSTLLRQSVPMLSSLRIALNTISNQVLKRRLEAVTGDVANGEMLYSAFSKTDVFTSFALNVIAVGEQSGKLAVSLERIAGIYEKDLATATKRFTALLEPVIILLLAIGLGAVVMAIVMPIFQLDVTF
jgi:general secretion pathway protein F